MQVTTPPSPLWHQPGRESWQGMRGCCMTMWCATSLGRWRSSSHGTALLLGLHSQQGSQSLVPGPHCHEATALAAACLALAEQVDLICCYMLAYF
jgi:hypothetical protein